LIVMRTVLQTGHSISSATFGRKSFAIGSKHLRYEALTFKGCLARSER